MEEEYLASPVERVADPLRVIFDRHAEIQRFGFRVGVAQNLRGHDFSQPAR